MSRGETTLEWLREEARLHTKILELDPDHMAARRLLGDLYGRLGQWEKADEQYTSLVKLDPESVTWRLWLAPVLMKLGQTERYRKLLQGRSLTTLPLAGAVEDYESAIQSMRATLERTDLSATDRAFYQSYLGCAYLRSGRDAEAIKWLETSIPPGSIRPYLRYLRIRGLCMLAMAHHERGNEAKAHESRLLAYCR